MRQLEMVAASSASLMLCEPVVRVLHARSCVLGIVASTLSQAKCVLGILVMRADEEEAIGAHQHFFPGFFGFSRSRSFMATPWVGTAIQPAPSSSRSTWD